MVRVERSMEGLVHTSLLLLCRKATESSAFLTYTYIISLETCPWEIFGNNWLDHIPEGYGIGIGIQDCGIGFVYTVSYL